MSRRDLRALLHELADAVADALDPPPPRAQAPASPAPGRRAPRPARGARPPRVVPADDTDRAFARRALREMGLLPGGDGGSDGGR